VVMHLRRWYWMVLIAPMRGSNSMWRARLRMAPRVLIALPRGSNMVAWMSLAIVVSCPHRPCEGQQHLDLGVLERAGRVIIAPTRANNKISLMLLAVMLTSPTTQSGCPRPCEGQQRLVGDLNRSRGLGSSSPYEGSNASRPG
jgi:hypothetical protein